MSRSTRYLLFFGGGALLAVFFVIGAIGMPSFGSTFHPYRDLSVPASVAHGTANVVSAINFDQRAIDVLGEETIFFGSVVGAAALLRPSKEEREEKEGHGGAKQVMASTRFAGYVLLPLTLVVGFDVVAHGHLTPGGGFQGGVVLATGVHLLYVAGSYDALERVRSVHIYEYGEVVGALGYVGLGFAGLAIAGSYLANIIPYSGFGHLVSAGNVEVLNFAVGIEVTSGVVVMLAHFLEQAIALQDRPKA